MNVSQWISWWTTLHPYGSGSIPADFLHSDVNSVTYLWDSLIEGPPPQFAPIDRRVGDDGNLLSMNVVSLFPTSPARDQGVSQALGTGSVQPSGGAQQPVNPSGGGPFVGPQTPNYQTGYAAVQAARAAANRAAAGTVSAAQRLAAAQAYAKAQAAAAAAAAAQGGAIPQPGGTLPVGFPNSAPSGTFPRFPLPAQGTPFFPPVTLPAKPIQPNVPIFNPLPPIALPGNVSTGVTNPNPGATLTTGGASTTMKVVIFGILAVGGYVLYKGYEDNKKHGRRELAHRKSRYGF